MANGRPGKEPTVMFASSMISDLWDMGEPVAEKVLRTILVYVGVLAILRLAGKRDLAQLNSFDLVVLLLISNVVQNAVIGSDNSVSGGLLGAAVLVIVNSVVVRVVRRAEWGVRLFEGSVTVLVRDGVIDEHAIARLGLRDADVVQAVRRQGASTLSEVAEAALKPGGTILVRLREEDENATKDDIRRLEAKLDQLLAG